jgi:uncharacterized lipoprotein
MLHFIRVFLIAALGFSLISCSHLYGENGIIKNRDTDYLKAESIPPLQIPAGYNSSSIQSNYPVSEKAYPAPQTRVDLLPPELNNPSN